VTWCATDQVFDDTEDGWRSTEAFYRFQLAKWFGISPTCSFAATMAGHSVFATCRPVVDF
jgi:hypothetical protein